MKILNLNTDVTLGGDESSDYTESSQKAVKTYVDNQVANVLPSTESQEGKVLSVKTDGTGLEWIKVDGVTNAVTHTPNESVGTEIKGVYVASDGTATEMAHTLESDVPSDAEFTDENVKQVNSVANDDYRIILSKSANDTTETGTTRKSGNFTANPSTGKMGTPTLVLGEKVEFTYSESSESVVVSFV